MLLTALGIWPGLSGAGRAEEECRRDGLEVQIRRTVITTPTQIHLAFARIDAPLWVILLVVTVESFARLIHG